MLATEVVVHVVEMTTMENSACAFQHKDRLGMDELLLVAYGGSRWGTIAVVNEVDWFTRRSL